MYNSILSIAPSALDENLLWVGTDDGQIHLTTDGGKSWKNLTKNIKGMPQEAWVAQIQASRYQGRGRVGGGEQLPKGRLRSLPV